jgi:AAA+ ATPase superfamily predicted ATPase
MKYEIVGREKEIQKLDEILASKEAKFLALYGRRRVGKTYLVRQFFKSCKFRLSENRVNLTVNFLNDLPLN